MVLENSEFTLTFFIQLFSIKTTDLVIWGLGNLRLTKYEEKGAAGERNGKCYKYILHVSYQLTVMFSTFSLLVYIKCF